MDEVNVMVALAFLGTSYVFASIVFLKFPAFLHGHRGRHRTRFRCRHISHRGGAGERLENTLTAFDNAVSLGTDMLEIDLQLTKDGVVVVSHDDHLLRTTGVDARISDLNYDELPPLSPRLRIDFDANRFCAVAGDRRIPRLVELFERYPLTLPVNIDIKTDNDTLIRKAMPPIRCMNNKVMKVSQLIIDHSREEYTAWGNFSEVIRRKCYKENPRVATYFSLSGVVKLSLLTYSGLLPFVPLQERFLEVFLPAVVKKKFVDGSTEKKRALRAGLWLIDKLLMRKFLFEHLQKRGIQVYLWVLNDEEDYERAFRIGATGVMTDYPSRLREFLDANPQFQ